ncbi:MAG TPA: sugar transferase [Candidatus Polarisedimenticolia bacterium]|jgi:lipopolysaccharide/colanic/teichoic acid biosynthesis glycosyltransferase|nr:sugar transferase [Candidatus Polarisedimenticolia bacterium]
MKSVAKRQVDVVVSVLLFALLSPLLLVAALGIWLTSPGPVIFVQRRLGYARRIFSMYKLRTMRVGAEKLETMLAAGRPARTFFKVEDDPRVTGLGRWLRKYSVDELPQLYNVLRGDMSLVGPRPLLISEVKHFPFARYGRRFTVRPGMTGLWQVSGRNDCSDRDRLNYDLAYVHEWSFWFDLQILLRTVPVVLRARGAY